MPDGKLNYYFEFDKIFITIINNHGVMKISSIDMVGSLFRGQLKMWAVSTDRSGWVGVVCLGVIWDQVRLNAWSRCCLVGWASANVHLPQFIIEQVGGVIQELFMSYYPSPSLPLPLDRAVPTWPTKARPNLWASPAWCCLPTTQQPATPIGIFCYGLTGPDSWWLGACMSLSSLQ